MCVFLVIPVYAVSFITSLFLFCFFKQKTAYEMRISDWSSDVCSSDLSFTDSSKASTRRPLLLMSPHTSLRLPFTIPIQYSIPYCQRLAQMDRLLEIGRASCRERVCQYV